MSNIDTMSKLNESKSFRKDILYLYDELNKQEGITSPQGGDADKINFEIPEADEGEEIDKRVNQSFMISDDTQDQNSQPKQTAFQKFQQGCSRCILKILRKIETSFRKARAVLLNIVLLYNVFFAPLNLALDSATHSGVILAIEVITILSLTMNFIVDYKDYRE